MQNAIEPQERHLFGRILPVKAQAAQTIVKINTVAKSISVWLSKCYHFCVLQRSFLPLGFCSSRFPRYISVFTGSCVSSSCQPVAAITMDRADHEEALLDVVAERAPSPVEEPLSKGSQRVILQDYRSFVNFMKQILLLS